MNLKDCESRFGFATDFAHDFVCVSLPDENNKCFGIEVGPTDSVPISSTLYVLYLNKDNDSIVDKFEEYTNSKEENIMTNTNITIYDRIEIGDTFHNSNGTDYVILAFNKGADVALLLNPKNKITPYVGTNGLRNDYWCYGHYFQTIQEASKWYNSML